MPRAKFVARQIAAVYKLVSYQMFRHKYIKHDQNEANGNKAVALTKYKRTRRESNARH